MKAAIGGYFELELPRAQPFIYQGALKYQSARAAFLALLRVSKPKRVWMPYYICDAMLAPVRASGAKVCFYSLDEQLGIADDITLNSGDILLYVNYFGICLEQVEKVLKQFDPSQVVLDFSQAFFVKPQKCLATIYSPRKFFGIPDGGLIFTELPLCTPEMLDTRSADRMQHLIKRLAGSPELGYEDYQRSETSLNDLEPRQMSNLTNRLLSSIDFADAHARRNQNFLTLHKVLGATNRLPLDAEPNGPLCYPYFSVDSGLRKKLISQRVFIPTYWADALSRISGDCLELDLVNSILPIPCDQRYSSKDMAQVLSCI
jgi:hypothetical protein